MREKVWKKSTTVVASIASQGYMGKEERGFELYCCPFSQAYLSVPRRFPMSRPEPYGLLRCAKPVLTRRERARFEVVKPDSKAKNGMVFLSS
jgi:hypothetical protein